MYIRRHLETPFLKANRFFPVLLVTGARQVGKTTFLHNVAEPGRRFVSLDVPDMQEMARTEPRLFLADNPPPVAIDEIQYVPELLPYIKERIDNARLKDPANAVGMYWLSGSQQFRMMKEVTESLAGRVGIFSLYGFSARELAGVPEAVPYLPENLSVGEEECSPVRFFERLWAGSYPGLLMSSDPRGNWLDFYRSYVQTYLERDVRTLSQVADLNVFYAFLKAVAARSAQMLNYSDIARDTGLSQPTVKGYLSILEASGIVKLLPPYKTGETASLVVATPKVYMLDTGLMAYLTSWTSPGALADGAMAGHFFETWCLSEILKSYAGAGQDTPFFYFRDKKRKPKEIDLIISRDQTLYPTEFKKSATLDRKDTRHFDELAIFKQPVATGAVVSLYPQKAHLREDVLNLPATAL
ncbi:MAG: ATP-binding protein [Victivallales bacterium]|nr:ATP-binding protein [Victivallales bacterium]